MSNIVDVHKFLLFQMSSMRWKKRWWSFVLLWWQLDLGWTTTPPPDSALALNPLNCGSQLWSAALWTNLLGSLTATTTLQNSKSINTKKIIRWPRCCDWWWTLGLVVVDGGWDHGTKWGLCTKREKLWEGLESLNVMEYLPDKNIHRNEPNIKAVFEEKEYTR